MKKERFDAITDAVLAIIATLMVLEIKVPQLSSGTVLSFLTQIGIYAISFALICILWLNHHHIFNNIERVDTTTVWFNFILLFIMSLFPLATRLISESFYNSKTHIFYGAVLAAATILYTILQDRVNKLSGTARHNKMHLINSLAMLICLLSIPLSLVSVYLSGAIFLLIPALYFVVSARPNKLPN